MRSTSVRVRGEVVLRERLRMGLSQRELAYLARPCSQTTIYLVESGRMAACSLPLARRLAKRLGLRLEEVVLDG